LNYSDHLHLIADILSFNSQPSQLKKRLESTNINWEEVVKISSQHLVLTTMYCRLKQKKLIELLPDELVEYLKNLTEINRNRNIRLIEEAKSISNLFHENNIEHVYFKGMGMLISNFYQDVGERLIGDIDILITPDALDKAYELLKNCGYDKSKGFNYNEKGFRHKPRLIDEGKLAAVELHRHILNDKKQHFLNRKEVFLTAIAQNSLYTANAENLYKINVLNAQINNNGHYYNNISFKNFYDNHILLTKCNLETKYFKARNKYFKSYHALFDYWQKNETSKDKPILNQLQLLSHRIKSSHQVLETSSYNIKSTGLAVKQRIGLWLKNPSYRKHIWKNKVINKSSSIFIS